MLPRKPARRPQQLALLPGSSVAPRLPGSFPREVCCSTFIFWLVSVQLLKSVFLSFIFTALLKDEKGKGTGYLTCSRSKIGTGLQAERASLQNHSAQGFGAHAVRGD